MSVTLYKIGGVHFRFHATNGFHVKAKTERFTPASSRCRQNLKYETFTSLFGRLRQKIAAKSVLHVQHDYFSSFNQSNHWFVALSLTLPSSDLKLPFYCCELALSSEPQIWNFHVLICLADYIKNLQQKACRTCSTIIFLHSTNQIIDLWRCC